MPAGQTWQRQFQGGTRYSRAFLNVCLKREPLKTTISSRHPSGNSPLLGLAASALEQQPHAVVVTESCCEMEGRPASAARGPNPGSGNFSSLDRDRPGPNLEAQPKSQISSFGSSPRSPTAIAPDLGSAGPFNMFSSVGKRPFGSTEWACRFLLSKALNHL